MGAEIIPIAAGDLLLGVRANDAEAERWLRELFAPVTVVADATPPPNVSVALGERQAVGRGLHLLYRGVAREVRTTSFGRLLRAVPAQLDGWLPPVPGTVRLSARVLVRDAGAILLDSHFDEVLARTARRLERAGFRSVDVPFAEFDAASFDLVLRPPRIPVDEAVATRLDEEFPRGDEEVALDGRRLSVLKVVSWSRSGELSGSERGPGASLASFALMAAERQRFTVADLEALARFMQTGVVTICEDLTEADLVNLARALA